MKTSLLTLTVFLCLPPLGASDVESLHTFNFNFGLNLDWSLQLHTRVRTFENVSAFNQFRAGPILTWNAAPRLKILSGYFFAEQNTRAVYEVYEVHRPWAGGEYLFFSGGGWDVEGRALLERFISSNFEDYWRWRARAKVNRPTPIGKAYASAEVLRHDIPIGRYTAGFRWKLDPQVTLGAGYEYRDAERGPGSHLISTILEWEVLR